MKKKRVKMLHAKTKHSTETQNQEWSTVHGVHI